MCEIYFSWLLAELGPRLRDVCKSVGVQKHCLDREMLMKNGYFGVDQMCHFNPYSTVIFVGRGCLFGDQDDFHLFP